MPHLSNDGRVVSSPTGVPLSLSSSSSRQQITSPHSVPPPPAYIPTTSSLPSSGLLPSSSGGGGGGSGVRVATSESASFLPQSHLFHQSLTTGEHHHHVMRVGQDSAESSISGSTIRREDSGLGHTPPSGGDSVDISNSQQSFTVYQVPPPVPSPVAHSISASAISGPARAERFQPGAQQAPAAPQVRGMSAEPGLSSYLGEPGSGGLERSGGGRMAASRRSPDGPRVQAVLPFGVRDNQIPPDCQVVKKLVREAAYTTGASASPPAQGGQQHVPSPPAYPGAYPPSTNPNNTNLSRDQYHSTLLQQQQAQGRNIPQPAQDPALQNMLQQYQALVQQQQQAAARSEAGVRAAGQQPGGSQQDLNAANFALPAYSTNFGVNPSDPQTATVDVAARANLFNAMANAQMAAPPGGHREHPNLQQNLQQNMTISQQGRELQMNNSSNASNNQQQQQPGGALERGENGNTVAVYGARDASPQDVGAHVSTRMLGVLSEDNKKLRQELEVYIKKTAKLQQLELHYQKIHREYEDLVRRQEKREQLESQMRKKMDIETRRFADENRILRDQLEQLSYQMHHYRVDEEDDTRHEMAKLNMIIAQLMPQNKELLACKERHEIELEAQRDTLEEQRNHIHILDKALAHTQERALAMEEECRQKGVYAQRVEELQTKLHLIHDDMMKREEAHKKARAQLQAEVAHLQIQKAKDSPSLSVKKGVGGLEERVTKLKKELERKDEEFLELKRKLLHSERKYYQDIEKKTHDSQIQEDTKDVRIRELEESSEKAERLAEESRKENENYREALREHKNHLAGLEHKLQRCETSLAEKEALIKVLRQQRKKSLTDSEGAGVGGEEPPRVSSLYRSAGDFSPLDITRHRLDAARRRLLQSPSPNRYSRIYNPKFSGCSATGSSFDASFYVDEINGSNGVDYSSLDRPGRHYKQKDATPPGLGGGRGGLHHRTESEGGAYNYSPTMGTNAFGKKREIYTLPDMRRGSRPKVSSLSGRGARPKSADEHMLAQQEECIEEAVERSSDASLREDSASPLSLTTQKSESQKSKERLFHV